MHHGNPGSEARQYSEAFEDLLAQEGGRNLKALENAASTMRGLSSSALTRPSAGCLRKHAAHCLPFPFWHSLACSVGCTHNTTVGLPVTDPRTAANTHWVSLQTMHLTSIRVLLKPPQNSLWYHNPCFTERKWRPKVSAFVRQSWDLVSGLKGSRRLAHPHPISQMVLTDSSLPTQGNSAFYHLSS